METLEYLRSFRICGIALFDLILAFVVTIWILNYFGVSTEMAAALTIPIGIISHVIFNIPTRLNYKLGLSEDPKKSNKAT
jgi:Na+-transporting methylmalonyl-CoA/oxaloacetate decarboxylase beta subunit